MFFSKKVTYSLLIKTIIINNIQCSWHDVHGFGLIHVYYIQDIYRT